MLGTAVGVAAWLALAVSLRRLSSPRYANSGVYRELAARHRELAAVAETLDARRIPRPGPCCGGAGDREGRAAEDGTGGDGAAWAGGAAYVVVFSQVHRAEQAVTLLMDDADVVRQALYERSCLLNSKIANAQEQISRLERAIHAARRRGLPRGAANRGRASRQAARPRHRPGRPGYGRRVPRQSATRARPGAQPAVRHGGLHRLVAYAGLGLALLAGAGTARSSPAAPST